jgi:hypothetical protein
MSRFMMQADGAVQPLSFDGGAASPPLLESALCPDWAGVPFELHRTRPFSHVRDSGPPSGERTLIVLVEGATELALIEGEGLSALPRRLNRHPAQERGLELKRLQVRPTAGGAGSPDRRRAGRLLDRSCFSRA